MINVGFIGCGAMGRDHVRRITDKCGNAQVVGVYDTVLGNAKQAIEDNRLDATIYDSADALIDDPNVDAVVIASRNDVHLDPLLHTIAIGKRRFTEKPMTINGSDSWKVVEARWPRPQNHSGRFQLALRPRLRRDEDLRRRRTDRRPADGRHASLQRAGIHELLQHRQRHQRHAHPQLRHAALHVRRRHHQR